MKILQITKSSFDYSGSSRESKERNNRIRRYERKTDLVWKKEYEDELVIERGRQIVDWNGTSRGEGTKEKGKTYS